MLFIILFYGSLYHLSPLLPLLNARQLLLLNSGLILQNVWVSSVQLGSAWLFSGAVVRIIKLSPSYVCTIKEQCVQIWIRK